jgi:hypothetical protein
MDDLVDKHFREDLTEEEDQALLDRLERSGDAALQYGAKAEQDYHSFGLPDPVPPSGGMLPAWLKWTVLGAMLSVAGLVWHFRACRTQEASISSMPVKHPGMAAPVVPSPVRQARSQGRLSTGNAALSNPPQEAQSHSREPRTLQADPPAIPPDIGSDERRPFNGVNVIVIQPRPGPVTVRVLSEGREEMRRLYDSTLDAGKWSFHWDGKLSDGKAAKPGLYRIEVKGARETEVWEVNVK